MSRVPAAVRVLIEAFAELTGHPATSPEEMLYVERYFSPHGGMSSGMVSPGFWRETAVPLLLARAGAKIE